MKKSKKFESNFHYLFYLVDSLQFFSKFFIRQKVPDVKMENFVRLLEIGRVGKADGEGLVPDGVQSPRFAAGVPDLERLRPEQKSLVLG